MVQYGWQLTATQWHWKTQRQNVCFFSRLARLLNTPLVAAANCTCKLPDFIKTHTRTHVRTHTFTQTASFSWFNMRVVRRKQSSVSFLPLFIVICFVCFFFFFIFWLIEQKEKKPVNFNVAAINWCMCHYHSTPRILNIFLLIIYTDALIHSSPYRCECL